VLKQDVLSAVFEVCVHTAYSHVSASLLSFSVTSFFTILRSKWVYPVLTSKIFGLHRGRKGKGTHFRHPTGPAHPSHPRTTLQFYRIAIPTQKISVFHHNKTAVKSRIPPIVIYSSLNNHSATLQTVNEKQDTSVDVKSKSHRLLLYMKSVRNYNVLSVEIQTAKLA